VVFLDNIVMLPVNVQSSVKFRLLSNISKPDNIECVCHIKVTYQW
jgi:hypothetical protein